MNNIKTYIKKSMWGWLIIPVNLALFGMNSSFLVGGIAEEQRMVPWLGSLILILGAVSFWMILPASEDKWRKGIHVAAGSLALKYLVFFVPIHPVFLAWTEVHGLLWAVNIIMLATTMPLIIGLGILCMDAGRGLRISGALLCIAGIAAWVVHVVIFKDGMVYAAFISNGDGFAIYAMNYAHSIILGGFLLLGLPRVNKHNQ
ncbi:MAG: hypothetical protein KJO21_03920 [Verrucomicrobiae bacterium]|nr:hypothetical protein [Verrucomicrobiae bacterium]NNJ42646.1 hypothetical protein [Akkermansiaceae bacterium]